MAHYIYQQQQCKAAGQFLPSRWRCGIWFYSCEFMDLSCYLRFTVRHRNFTACALLRSFFFVSFVCVRSHGRSFTRIQIKVTPGAGCSSSNNNNNSLLDAFLTHSPYGDNRTALASAQLRSLGAPAQGEQLYTLTYRPRQAPSNYFLSLRARCNSTYTLVYRGDRHMSCAFVCLWQNCSFLALLQQIWLFNSWRAANMFGCFFCVP